MRKTVSSGRIGAAQFLILPQESEYSVTVITPTKTYKTKTLGWQTAKNWVDKIIKTADGKDESDRNY